MGWLRRPPLCRPRLHRAIILRVEYQGQLLLSMDSDALYAAARLGAMDGWTLYRAAEDRDWPEIIIKPVMLPG